MILSVTVNPCVDRTVFVESLTIGDTNRVVRTETDAGGKGINVSRVAKELGAATLALGFLGGRTAKYILDVLQEEEVPYEFVPISGETRMNVNIETNEGGAPTTLNELGPGISSEAKEALLSRMRALSEEAQYVCLGGSLPPGLPSDTFARSCAELSHQRVVVDADGEPMRLVLGHKPWMVKPNAKEAARLLGTRVESPDEALSAARELRGAGVCVALVSMGASGAAMVCDDGEFFAKPPDVVTVSTIGSGDSMIAGFLCAHSQGEPLRECLRWGVAAGAATATTNAAEICRRPVFDSLLPKVEVKP